MFQIDENGENFEDFQIKNNHGDTVLRIGFYAALYFDGSHISEVRKNVVNAILRYTDMAKNHLSYKIHPESREWVDMNDNAAEPLEAWIPNLGEYKGFSLIYKGGTNTRDVDYFQFICRGGPVITKAEPGCFVFSLPMSWYHDKTDFTGLMSAFCHDLRPFSGYAGLGILERIDEPERNRHAPLATKLAAKYPGLIIDDIAGSNLAITETRGIMGGNWFTMISDFYYKELGGVERVQSELSGNFEIREYPGGLLVRAGELPRLGNTEENDYPPEIAKINQFLKPIRVRFHRGFHLHGPDRMHGREVMQWLARFD